AQPPKLTKIEPADNAQIDATDAVVIQATFNVAIDPTSVQGGIVVTNLNTRTTVAGTVALEGANVVRFRPAQPISAATQYSVTVTPNIRGLNGAPFGRAAVATFTTRAIPFNNTINRDLIKIEMPDANGKSKITGLAGAIPGGAMAVAIRRGRTFIESYTKEAATDGAFVLDIGHLNAKDRITLADIIELQVLDRVSKGIIAMIRLTPFVKPDGRSFFVSPDVDSRLVTPEGIVVVVPAGAFDALTEVRVDPAPVSVFTRVPAYASELNYIAGVDLQFEGQSKKPLEIEVPIPAGTDTAGRTFLLGRLGDSVRGPRIEIDDLVSVSGNMLTTRDVAPVGNARLSVRSNTTAAGGQVKEYLLKVHGGAKYCFLDIRVPVGMGVGWIAIDGIQQGLDMFFSALQSLYISNFYLTAKRGRVVAPMLTGVPFHVEGVDTATGMTDFTSQYDALPPAEPGTFQPLPSPQPNPSGPYPIFAKPFNVDVIEIPIADEDLTPVPGFKIRLTGSTSDTGPATVTRTGSLPKTFSVVNLDSGSTGTGAGDARTVYGTKVGERLLIASSADSVEPTREVQIVFNEAIEYGGDVSGLEDYLWLEKDEPASGAPTPNFQKIIGQIEFTVDSGDRRVTMTFPGELQRGATYRVVIDGSLTDKAGPNAKSLVGGTMYLPFTIRKPAGDLLGSSITLSKGSVRDLALDGNLLFVSALEGGLQTYDVSNPASLASLTPHAYTVPFPEGSGQQWAIEIDHHGRIWTTAQNNMYGLVRSFRVEDFHAGGRVEPKATGIVSWRVGINVGLPLGTTWSTLSDRVEATPRRLQILAQDQYFVKAGGPTFVSDFAPNELGATVSQTGSSGDFKVFTVVVPKSTMHFRTQRVTVENLTLGTRWSKDILIYDGQATAQIENVLVRDGDQIRVSRNHSTYGAVSLFGFGVGLFDLNAIETNHWHSNLPGPDFEQPGEQIMVTEAKVQTPCQDPNGPDGNPCAPPVMTYTADAIVVTGSDDSGQPLLNVLALESTKGIRSVIAQPIPGSRESTGPDMSPYGPLGANVSFTEAIAFTSRNVNPPVDHPRLATIRKAFLDKGRKLNGRFSTIGRYDKLTDCVDPATGESTQCRKSYALVSGYQFGILVVDASKPLTQDSLVDIIWVPAGAVAVRVIPGTRYATATDGNNRALLIDLTRIDESDTVPALTACATPASPSCTQPLFKTVEKALLAGPDPYDPLSFGSDDPRIIWKSEAPTDVSTAGSLAPVADPETGFLFKGDLTGNKFRVYSGVDPHVSVKVNFGTGELTNVSSIVPLGIQRPLEVDEYVKTLPPCEDSGSDVEGPTRCRENVSQGVFRVEIALPGSMTSEIAKPTLAIESERIPGAVTEQTRDPLPRAHLRQRKANGGNTERAVDPTKFYLRRVIDTTVPGAAALRYQKGYNRFVSPWIVAIADPRARKDYKFELNAGYGSIPGFGTREEAGCFQCELPRFLKNKTADEDYFELYTAGRTLLIRPEFMAPDVSNYDGTDYDYLGENQRLYTRITTTMADTVRPANVLTAAQNPPVAEGVFQGTVFLHSGEVSTSALDLDAGGRAGWNVLLDRTYHSRTIGGTAFGFGWDSGIFKRLRVLPTGDVEYRDGSGEVWLFTKDGTDYLAPKGYFYLLVRTTEGWTLVDQKRRLIYFDDYGRVIREGDAFYTTDGKGNQIRYLYDSDGRLSKIIDPSERPTSVYYYSDAAREGLVDRIEDWRKRLLRYRYESGRLVEVNQPAFSGGLPTTRYKYTGGGGTDQDELELATNLEYVMLPNEVAGSGRPRVTFAYGASAGAPRDYVGNERWATNETARYEYSIGGASPTAKTTDVLGQVREYTFELPQFPPAGTSPGAEIPDLYRYAIDRTHVKTRKERDVETANLDFGELPTSVSATSPLATTTTTRNYTFEYDGEGQLEKEILEGVSTASSTYETLTGLAGSVPKCAGVATGGSDPCSASTPGSDAVRFEFAHNGGYLNSVTANGSKIASPEAHRGTPSLTEPNESHQATTTYDLQTGLPTAVTTSGGTSSTSTANAQVEYKYPETVPSDLYKRGLPIKALSGSGNKLETEFRYPSENQVVMVDPDGVTTTIDLDSWRRPTRLEVKNPADPALLVEEYFEYFPAGELKEHRRRLNNVGGSFVRTTYLYDESGRLTNTTIDNVKVGTNDFDSKTAEVDYSRYFSERVIVTKHPSGAVTTTKLDSLGRVKSSSTTASASGGTVQSVFVYDKGGNVAYASDLVGSAVARAHDGNGRVRKSLTPDGVITEADYDGWGNITALRMKRSPGEPPFFVRQTDYTDDGKIERTTESGAGGNSRTTEHVWDAAGRDAGVSVKSNAIGDPGRVTMTTYDDAGRVLSTTFGAGQVDSVSAAVEARNFLSYGVGSLSPTVRTTEALSSNAYTLDRGFDALGRTKNVTLGPLNWTDERDQAGNPVKSALPGRDASNRLFDALGNVRSETLPDGSQQKFQYGRAGSPLAFADAASTGPADDTTVEPDLIGRPHIIHYPDTTTHQIEYEGSRVRAVKDRQNRWQSFEYDTRGKLVAVWGSATVGAGERLDKLEYNDGTGRLTAWTNKDTRIEYEDYDFNGNPRVTRQIRYKNGTGLATAEVLDQFEQVHTWNGYGERTEVTFPGDPTPEWTKKLAMEYDAAGNLSRLLTDGVELVNGQYHNAGRPKSRTIHLRQAACSGAGCDKKLVRDYAYDPTTGQLIEMSAKLNGTEIAGSRVSYGDTLQVQEAQLLGVSGNGRKTRYSYDERSRLFGSVVAADGDITPPEPEGPGGGVPVEDAAPGVAQEVLSKADFRGEQSRAQLLDDTVRTILETRGIDPDQIDPPGSSATEEAGHKVATFRRGTISKTFEYDGSLRSGDDRFYYQYDAKQRLIAVVEKPTSTAVPVRRIVYAYDGNDRMVGRTASYALPPAITIPEDTWDWKAEDRAVVLAADGLPAETTFVWDPIADRLVSVFRTGASRIAGDPHHDILKQFIHGDITQDDPLEVTSVDPSQPVGPGGAPALARLYPIYDEVAGGTLQAIVDREGAIVARSLTTDPFGAEQFALSGAAIDRVEIEAAKDAQGNLISVTVSMSATEQLAEGTIASGARLAVVTGGGTVVRTAAAAPSLASGDAFTIRWTLDAAQWNALIDPDGSPVSLSVAATSSLRAAVWAIDVPIVAAPAWAQATSTAVLSSSALPVEIREPLAELESFIGDIGSNGRATTTPYAITSLNLLGVKGTGNAADLLLASTFKAQPFVEPLTRIAYVRARWYDAATGTFLTPDPRGYKDSANLYAFAAGDPVNKTDPSGTIAESVWDFASLGLGITSLSYNLKEGNVGAALLDTAGIILDGAALLTPFVPGGAGAVLKASRAAGLLAKARLVEQTITAGQGAVTAVQEYQKGNFIAGTFNAAMSGLGFRGMDTSPFKWKVNGIGSNGGNIGMVRKELQVLRRESRILQMQREITKHANRVGASMDAWLMTPAALQHQRFGRFVKQYQDILNNPLATARDRNFARMIRGRFVDRRMRQWMIRRWSAEFPNATFDRRIPDADSTLRPDAFFPDIEGQSVIFDFGGPSKITDIEEYEGLADIRIPVIPTSFF
ncbi:MAG TPA: Ig-like domain-containing protein, partial [Thermoanaerobaculia bacterium]|nr:Ig-like domain-containing protein [Thermoanaerobaculia bacterium]